MIAETLTFIGLVLLGKKLKNRKKTESRIGAQDNETINYFIGIDNGKGYISSGETRKNEDGEIERLVYIPKYFIFSFYAENTNPERTEYEKIEKALKDIDDRPDTDENYFEPYNELRVRFDKAWIDEEGDIIEQDWGSYSIEDIDSEELKDVLGIYDEAIEIYSFDSNEETRENTEDILVTELIKQFDGNEYESSIGIVYLDASGVGGKYSQIIVKSRETDEEVGYITIRIADHSYNPRNNYREEGAFISIVLNSNDPTKERFHGRYNLRYSEDEDVETILEDVEERIEEIMYDEEYK